MRRSYSNPCLLTLPTVLILFMLISACASQPPAISDTPAVTVQSPLTPVPSLTPAYTPSVTVEPAVEPTPLATAAPEDRMKSVSQLGGSFRGIVAHGDTAFVGMGPRLAAINVSNPASPQLIAAGPSFQGMVNALAPLPANPSLLVVGAGRSLHSADISDPTNITLLHQLQMPGGIISLVVDPDETSTSILYVGGAVFPNDQMTGGFIAAVRVNADGSLELLSQVAIPDSVSAVALGPRVLYAGAEEGDTSLFGIRLSAPGELGTVQALIESNPEMYRPVYHMQATNERLYIGSYQGLFAFDLRDPLDPLELWMLPAMMTKDFVLEGEQVHIFGWVPAGAYLPFQRTYDLPETVTGSPGGIVASSVALQNGHFIVSAYQLETYTAGDKTSMPRVGFYHPALSNILGSTSDDQQVYVLEERGVSGVGDFKLSVLRLPDLFPISETSIRNKGNFGGVDWFRGMALEGDRLYVAGIDGVDIFDITTTAPSLLGYLAIGDAEAYELLQAIAPAHIDGSRLLFAARMGAGESSVITVYNMTNPGRPKQVGLAINLPGENVQPGLMLWMNGRLHIATIDGILGYLRILSFSEGSLAAAGRLSLPEYPSSMAVQDDFVVLSGQYMSVLSASDLNGPQLLGRITLPGQGVRITTEGDQALVAVTSAGSLVQILGVDLADPTNPRIIHISNTAFEESRIGLWQTGERYLVLAGYSSGLEVLEKSRD
jgi:hypothetical protein